MDILKALAITVIGLTICPISGRSDRVLAEGQKAQAPLYFIDVPAASRQLKENVIAHMAPGSVDAFLKDGSADEKKNSSGSNLALYSITLNTHGKVAPSRFSMNPSDLTDDYRGTINYIPVSRIGDRAIVSIIKTVPGRCNVLNPVCGFNYGPIPTGKQMTLEDADILWGKPVKEDYSEEILKRRYCLNSTNSNNKTQQFFFDCEFFKGRLYRLKVRGPGADVSSNYDSVDDLWFGHDL